METPLTAESSATLAEGRYRLIEVIGSGGMATVYRAFDARLQVPRAIKVLLPSLANRERLRARFEAEARTMALLEHRNIVRVYDVGSEGNRVYIVMELVDGGSLVDRLDETGPLPPRQAVDVCLAVLEGLSVAHSREIVHRDIKPHNVMLTRKGETRVTDFGIARLARGNDSLTKTGAIMGTWGFMAPEQRADSKAVDARADLYSVAATLYSCVTNETPMDLFAAELDSSMLARIPGPLSSVIRRATMYDREERYPTAAEMTEALRAIRDQLPATPEDAPPLMIRPSWVMEEPAAAAPLAPEAAVAAEQQEEPSPPTMVPGSLHDDGNYTFDALGSDLAVEQLEAAALEAAKGPRQDDTLNIGSGDSIEDSPPGEEETPFDPPKRSPTGLLVALFVGAALVLLTTGWALWPDGQEPVEGPAVTPDGPIAQAGEEQAPPPEEPAPEQPAPDPMGEPDPSDEQASEPGSDPQSQPEDPSQPEGTSEPSEPSSPPQPAENPQQQAVSPQPEREQPSSPAVASTPQPAEPAPAPDEPEPAMADGAETQPSSEQADGEASESAQPEPAQSATPSLIHSPVTSASLNAPLTFSARITRGQYKVTVYYRPVATGAPFRSKVMVLRSGSYRATVTLDDSYRDGLEYSIKAEPEEPGLPDLASGSGFKRHKVSVH